MLPLLAPAALAGRQCQRVELARASLEDARSRERHNFASLQLLFAFLLDKIGEALDSKAATPDDPL